MDRKDEIVKRRDAIRLLEKAKEIERALNKLPVRINKNTVVLVSPDKLLKMKVTSLKGKHQKTIRCNLL